MGERTSDPTGVIGCTEEVKNPTMACMLNHTIVEFRPLTTWRGEFGFDWLRIDDTPATQYEIKYEDCILDGYHSKTADLGSSHLAYNTLKKEYHKLNVTSHRSAPNNEYYIPWLNLYSQDVSEKINNDYKAKNGGADLPVKPPYEAELRLIVNVQGDTKPKELEIVFPSEYFTIAYPAGSAASGSPIKIPATDACFTPNSPGRNYDLPPTIKITCIKEFSKNQYIDVWAYHYEHNQAKLDQLEQENKQLNDTDIPALEQEKAALETEAQTLEGEIKTQEAQVSALEQTVKIQEAAIATLEELCSIKTQLQMTGENVLQAYEALSDEAKKITDVEDFKILNQPGEREKLQEQIEAFKAEAAKLEAEIKQKTAELEAPKKELEAAQAELEKKKTELAEKQKQIEDKQKEIEQHQEKIKENTEEMNKVQGRSLAGKLCVLPNSSKYRKESDVVVIKVLTDISSSSYHSTGRDLTNREINAYYRTLYQSLVYTTFTTQRRDPTSGNLVDIQLDLRADANFKAGGQFIAAPNLLIDDATTDPKYPNQGTHIYLRKKFEKDVGKYPKSIHIFMFDEESYFAGGLGIVQKIGGPRNFLITSPAADPNMAYVIAHESLHCFSLYHTHRDSTPLDHANQKYVFEHGQSGIISRSTWNIMSYRENSYYTWKWQWDLIHKNIG